MARVHSRTQLPTPPITGVPSPTYLAYHPWEPKWLPAVLTSPVYLCATPLCRVYPNQCVLTVC